MADVPHAWPAYLLPEQKQAIRDALAQNNLAISNINAFMMHAVNDPRQKYWHPSWIEPDRHYRQVRIDHTKRALTLAKELGATCITTEPGGPVEGRPWAECLKLFVEMLKPVVEHAEKEGVLLLVEPEPDLLIETADQYLEFAATDLVAVPRAELRHRPLVLRRSDDPAATVRRLAKLHPPRPPGRHRRDAGPPPPDPRRGRDRLRQRRSTALKDIGYDGWVTIELYTCHENPDHAARTARERVLKIAEDVGVDVGVITSIGTS